jgi:hypothetical protein
MAQVITTGGAGGGSSLEVPSNIYISAANGNDANDGLTPFTPIQTVDRLWGMFPAGGGVINSLVVVHWGSGTYTYVTPPKAIVFSDQGGLIFHGDGAGQPGDDGFVELGTGTVTAHSTAGGALIVTDGGAAWVTDEWTGKTVQITSGANVGWLRTVIENTATTYEYVGRGYTAILPGDTFRFVESGVTLVGVGTPFTTDKLLPGPIVFINFRLQSNDTLFASPWIPQGSFMGAYGLELDALSRTRVFTYHPMVAIAGYPQIPFGATPPAIAYTQSLFPTQGIDGWGVSGWDNAVAYTTQVLSYNFILYGTIAGFTNVGDFPKIIQGRIDGLFHNTPALLHIAGGVIKDTKFTGNIIISVNSGANVRFSSFLSFPSITTRLTSTTKSNNQIRENSSVITGFPGASFTLPAILTASGARVLVSNDGPLSITTSAAGTSISFTDGSLISGRIPLTVPVGGQINITDNSELSLTGNSGAAITNASLLVQNGSRLVLNSNTSHVLGSVTIQNYSSFICGNSFTATAVNILDGSTFFCSAPTVTLTSRLLIERNAEVTISTGAWSISSGGLSALEVNANSDFAQTAGSLALTSGAAPSVAARSSSRLLLLGSTTSDNQLHAASGSIAWFSSDPVGFGTAVPGAELRVGTLASQSKAGLALAGDFITDTPAAASVGSGGASIIGRTS